jgi:hypothetical protein
MSRAFTGGGGAIVAGGAGTGDPTVIKVHGSPVGGDVAIIADITGR